MSRIASAGRIRPLAQEHVEVLRSTDPERIHVVAPGVARLPSGRLLVTAGLRGPGLAGLPGPRANPYEGRPVQLQVFTSDDGGLTFHHRADLPIVHARPFAAGGRAYIIGHDGDLLVSASDDEGVTWSEPRKLTSGQTWHQSACNVWYTNGCVYLVMERRVTFDIRGWMVGEFAPVLMRGRVGDDLTRWENWTFASELSFRDVVGDGSALDWFGVPFYEAPYPAGSDVESGRRCAPIGWLETNVVQIVDPDHVWHDPSGRTLHLLARAHTGGTGYAALAKAVEKGATAGTGAIETTIETMQSGKRVLYLPCPGGQMRFHLVYDEPSKRYWLLSTQATDSMRRPEALPKGRYGLPNNERRRLVLHFSRNLVDWCFAGVVAIGETEVASRHYASMAIEDEDLVVVSRSGDARSTNAHDTNVVTLHRVAGFRDLVY